MIFGGVFGGGVRKLRGTYVREAERDDRAERRAEKQAEKRSVREIYIFIGCKSVSGKSERGDFWLGDWANGCSPFYKFVK